MLSQSILTNVLSTIWIWSSMTVLVQSVSLYCCSFYFGRFRLAVSVPMTELPARRLFLTVLYRKHIHLVLVHVHGVSFYIVFSFTIHSCDQTRSLRKSTFHKQKNILIWVCCDWCHKFEPVLAHFYFGRVLCPVVDQCARVWTSETGFVRLSPFIFAAPAFILLHF